MEGKNGSIGFCSALAFFFGERTWLLLRFRSSQTPSIDPSPSVELAPCPVKALLTALTALNIAAIPSVEAAAEVEVEAFCFDLSDSIGLFGPLFFVISVYALLHMIQKYMTFSFFLEICLPSNLVGKSGFEVGKVFFLRSDFYALLRTSFDSFTG